MGYSQMFEAYIPYTKDRWCSPSCQCLHYAAASGDDALTEAAAEGRKPFTRKHGLEDGDDAGRTPIMVAAWKGNAKCVKWLAEHGANLNAVDKRGRTVAIWACLSTNTFAVMEPLCGKNVDVTKKDFFGDTCLHKVVVDRDLKTAALLCKFFPRLTTIKNKAGKLPMELAAPHKALVQVVSPLAAAKHVKDEKDKLLKMALEMEEVERLALQQRQIEEFEQITHKRRASAAGAAGIQAGKFQLRSETVQALTGIDMSELGGELITDDKDEWFELEGGRSLQSLAEQEALEGEETLEVDDQDEELEEEEQVSFFSSMVDVVNKKEMFFRREGRGRRNRNRKSVASSPMSRPSVSGQSKVDKLNPRGSISVAASPKVVASPKVDRLTPLR